MGQNNSKEIMLLTEREACELSLKPGITAIIATYNSSPRLFALSLLSLLARSTTELEHVIVTINGPDERTGSTEYQDLKQKFLEKIRRERWHGKDMPLTVQRVWSRLSHSQAIDSAVPWVHTKHYLLMHDDVLVFDNTWAKKTLQFFENPKVGVVKAFWLHALDTVTHGPYKDGGMLINFPHPFTFFVVLRKSILINHNWSSYFVEGDFRNLSRSKAMIAFNKKHNKGIKANFPDRAKYMTYDIGSWIMYYLQDEGYEFKDLPEESIVHFYGLSWHAKAFKRRKMEENKVAVEKAERTVREELPHLFKIYFDLFGDYRFDL